MAYKPQYIPETPEDQQFLIETKNVIETESDLEFRSMQLRMIAQEACTLSFGIVDECTIIIAIKEILRLPFIKPNDSGADKVISNAIREAVEICGTADYKTIFQQLRERRRKLLLSSETEQASK